MEGVMMRNNEKVAVALRLPDGSVHVDTKKVKLRPEWTKKVPILRGIIAFVDSLVMGMSTLMDSAAYFEEEPTDKKELTAEEATKAKRKESAEMTGTVILAVLIALVIFMGIPYGVSYLLGMFVDNQMVLALIEGLLRIGLFVGYVLLISLMDDIKRTFMYHGAEHKCINCIESGEELTVDNVRAASKEHKRCGTSFLLFVMIISVVAFMFIRLDSAILQLGARLLLIPIIAGISYEFIRLAGTSDNCIISAISKPGLWLQGLTTKEPDDSMIEVGIASVEAVFDWREFQGREPLVVEEETEAEVTAEIESEMVEPESEEAQETLDESNDEL